MYHFDWLKRHAERTPDKLAVVDAHTGRKFSYAQFNARTNRFASFLKGTLQLNPGDRVSILAQNSSDYYEILFACGKVGVILNTLNWRLAVPELEYIINDCAPRALIYEPDFATAVDGLRSEIGVDYFICMDDHSPTAEWTYEGALLEGSPDNFQSPRLTYQDTWAILYTSGTTGRPKGAQVTYGNFFYNAIGMGQAIDLTSQDVNLNVLPTFHAGGLGLHAGPTFHAGGTVIVMRSFDAEKLLSLIEKFKVSVILLVPSIYLILSQYPDFDKHNLSSIRSWSSGGSSLPPSLVQQYAEKGILIQQGSAFSIDVCLLPSISRGGDINISFRFV